MLEVMGVVNMDDFEGENYGGFCILDYDLI